MKCCVLLYPFLYSDWQVLDLSYWCYNHTLRLSIQNVVEHSAAPHRRALQTNYEWLLLFISQRIGEIDWNWEA